MVSHRTVTAARVGATRAMRPAMHDCDSGARTDPTRRLGVGVRRHNWGVEFSADIRDRVANGTITVTYRLWSRPKVKVGGVYRSVP